MTTGKLLSVKLGGFFVGRRAMVRLASGLAVALLAWSLAATAALAATEAERNAWVEGEMAELRNVWRENCKGNLGSSPEVRELLKDMDLTEEEYCGCVVKKGEEFTRIAIVKNPLPQVGSKLVYADTLRAISVDAIFVCLGEAPPYNLIH